MRNLKVWQLWGFAVTAIGGTLLHFAYEWTNGSLLAAPFSGVNESTWEHMKLLYFPMLLFSVLQSIFFREDKRYWCIKLRGTLLGLFGIPALFYTYNGAIGPSPDRVNIAIFFVSAAAVYLYELRAFENPNTRCRAPKAALLALILIGVLFVLFTLDTPMLPIFRDPVTGGYGIASL